MAYRTSRWISMGAIALVASLGVSGCASGGTESGENTAVAPPAREGDISMWSITTPPLANILPESVNDWNSENPDAQIGVDFFANDDYKTKVRTAIGAGEGPTMIYGWGGGILESYVEAGEVADLTPYLDEYPQLKDRYIPSVLENGMVNEKMYAVPNSYSQPVVLYYNKEVFEQVGVEPPETFDELMALVDQFNAEGITPISLAGQSRWPNLMWLSYLVDRIGGPDVFQAIVDNEPNAWSHPAVIEALTKIQEMVDSGAFAEGFTSINASGKADQAMLYTGRAAMMLHLAAVYGDIKGSAEEFVTEGNLGYVPFPAVENGEGDPKNVVGNPSNVWSVSSRASEEQIDIAVDYMANEMLNEDYVNDLIDAGSAPAVKGIEEKIANSEDSDFLNTVYNMSLEAPNFQLSWDQALSPGQADAMLTNLDLIFLKEQTPEQFVSAMNETIE